MFSLPRRRTLTLARDRGQVEALAEQLRQVEVLAGQLRQVEALAGQLRQVEVLAGQLRQVEVLAGQLRQVEAVAAGPGEVEALAGEGRRQVETRARALARARAEKTLSRIAQDASGLTWPILDLPDFPPSGAAARARPGAGEVKDIAEAASPSPAGSPRPARRSVQALADSKGSAFGQPRPMADRVSLPNQTTAAGFPCNNRLGRER